MTDRKIIKDRKCVGSHFDTYGESLTDMKEIIEELIKLYGENAILEIDAGYNNVDFEIVWSRTETDEEYRKRLKQEERKKKAIEDKREKEYREYLRLKTKFEDE